MVTPFTKALLERKHNVGQQFANGWLFGQVVNYEDCAIIFDRYDSLAAGSGNATIAGGAANYWHEWMNAQQQKYLRERDADKVLQAFIGIYPPRLRLFMQFPMPISRGELYEIKVPAVLTALAGGWVNGEWSPYETPTTLTEMIVPPEMTIGFGVFNTEGVAVNPRFLLYIRRLQLQYFNPDTTVGKKKIEEITSGKAKARLWSPGLQPFEYDVSDRIGVPTYKWTPDVLRGDEE